MVGATRTQWWTSGYFRQSDHGEPRGSDQITGDVCGSFKRFKSPALAEVWDRYFYHFMGRRSHFLVCELVSMRPHLTGVNGHIYTGMMGFVSTPLRNIRYEGCSPSTAYYIWLCCGQNYSIVVNERWNLYINPCLAVWCLSVPLKQPFARVMAVLYSRACSFSSHLCYFGPFSVEQPACGGGGRVIPTFSQQLEMFKFKSFVFLILTTFLDCSQTNAANSAPF